MKITALAPWFGAKRTLAPRIVEALGPHRCYWEPFCGSMAVLLAKPPCSTETVNDLHGDLVNLSRVIADDRQYRLLLRRLRRTLFSKSLADESHERLAEESDPLDRAYWYFVQSWMGRNGNSGTSSANAGFCVRYTDKGGSPSKRFASAVESIPAWHRRMRSVVVLNGNAFDLLARIDDAPGTAIYCDPPYLAKGAKYVHDFTAEDHARLAELLRRFTKARVVVSYYDHPRLSELYPGWRCERIEVTKALVNQGQRDKGGATKAVEVLLTNEPPQGGRLFA